jgi:hypothetical protein
MAIPPISGRDTKPPDAQQKNLATTRRVADGDPSPDDLERFREALDVSTLGGREVSGTSGADDDASRISSSDPSSLFRRHEAADQQSDTSDRRGKRDGERRNKSDDPTPPSGAEAVLRNLNVEPAGAEEAPPPVPNSTLSDMVNEVADRILVGQTQSGSPEVRIQLKNEVLDGTEVRVAERDGGIGVTFVAATKDIENFLTTRAGDIATALGDRLQRDVRVEVTNNEAASAQADTDRGQGQSGGGQQGGRQQGEDQPRDGQSSNEADR